jgi:hypothetical protein
MSRTVSADGVADDGGTNPVSGYTVVRADSIDANMDTFRPPPLQQMRLFSDQGEQKAVINRKTPRQNKVLCHHPCPSCIQNSVFALHLQKSTTPSIMQAADSICRITMA